MINFLLAQSKNYTQVEATIAAEVQASLPPGSWTSSLERLDDHLNFSLFIRYPADVVMSHGVADKNYFTDARDEAGDPFTNRLKHVFVPGEWLRQKLLRSPLIRLGPQQIHSVGWPRLDMLRRLVQTQPAVTGTPVPTILWAPTHDFVKRGVEKQSTSTFPALQQNLPQLRKCFTVNVSVHPRNRPEKSPTDLALVQADYVISDFGTMVYEAWALGKPVFFPRWILKDRIQEYISGSAEAYIFEKRIGHHPDSIDEMMDMLQSNPTVGEDVRGFMREYLLNFECGCSSRLVADTLMRLDRERQ